MSRVHQVKLEIVRPGPPHNQLLSPLTPYMALCGAGSPVTFHLDFEHYQFLSRLGGLRYVEREGSEGIPITEKVRQETVEELGRDVSKILDEMRTLLAEGVLVLGSLEGQEGNSRDEQRLMQVRLVFSGSELALIPFEMAFAPQAFPGEGLEWTLQNHLPTVLTREIRQARPNPVSWNPSSKPRVLLVGAAPGRSSIPLEDHVRGLRKAVAPWLRRVIEFAGQDEESLRKERLSRDEEILRILPQASLEQIHEVCAQEDFTHVHILAHGDHYEDVGQKRFGVCLHAETGSQQKEVVSGKRLAQALLAESDDGSGPSQPVVVTLMICDSANQDSVLVPGGSIAHDLHVAGIPWIFASQFPLTVRGSVILTEDLYRRLLSGDDPRQALYEGRRKLFMLGKRDHDWASLAAYSSMPADFEDQVWDFFERQMRRAIEVLFDYADRLGSAPANSLTMSVQEVAEERRLQYTKAYQYLTRWENCLPRDATSKSRIRVAEYYGMLGSTHKRIGLLLLADSQGPEETQQALRMLWKARETYWKAAEQWVLENNKFHWVTTQYLSLGTVVDSVIPEQPSELYLIAHRLAENDLVREDEENQAWAHGTLAELDLLGAIYGLEPDLDGLMKSVAGHCQEIVEITGPDSFAVRSTRQQFERYRKIMLPHMEAVEPEIKNWIEAAADKAVDVLTLDDDILSRMP